MKKVEKKSNKAICNEVGFILLDYKDFLIKEEDVAFYQMILNKYRHNFKMNSNPNKMINTCEFGLYSIAAAELINFYNNDICLEAAKAYTMIEGGGHYNFRVITNLIDTLSYKICSCWEYIFQILNQYFSIELSSMNMNRDMIKKMYEKKMVFLEETNGYKVKYVDWTDEERRDIDNIVRRKRKILDVRKGALKFKKEIKIAGYSVSDKVEQISSLYSKESVNYLKDKVRNTIAHKKSATFAIAVGDLNGLSSSEGIALHKEGWIKIDEYKVILIDNLINLQKAIQIFFDIICTEDKLVHIGNESNEYRIVVTECPSCKHITNITDKLYALRSNNNIKVKCSKCGDYMNILRDGLVNECDYEQIALREFEEYFGGEVDLE